MNVLQSPFFWIITIAIIVVAWGVATVSRKSSEWGFKEVVKNPGYMDELSRSRREVDSAAEVAKGWSDEKVATATRQYILESTSSRDAWNKARILESLGERTHSTVLELLRDPLIYHRLVAATGKDILSEAPFNRACDLLGDAPPAEAVEVLAPFLNDPSDEIRKDAAMRLAKTGGATLVPYIRKTFSDPDEYVRAYALMGLKAASERSAISDTLRVELLPDLFALLRANQNAEDAAEIFYRFDPTKAKEFFLSPEVFTSGSPILYPALKVLAEVKVPVSPEMLQPLIASLETSELKYPKTYALGAALRLLGQQKREEDRELLQKHTNHPEEIVAEGAAAGLIVSFGLEGFDQRIWDKESQSGFASLKEPQQFYSAVWACDGEINNGGLSQYFFNSSGNQWREALAGFKAMGFKERLSIFEQAIALFGNDGPSADREIRQGQLSKLYRRNAEIFDALEDRYYKSKEVVEVITARFALENPEAFR